VNSTADQNRLVGSSLPPVADSRRLAESPRLESGFGTFICEATYTILDRRLRMKIKLSSLWHCADAPLSFRFDDNFYNLSAAAKNIVVHLLH
jgi:hypothetical protein